LSKESDLERIASVAMKHGVVLMTTLGC